MSLVQLSQLLPLPEEELQQVLDYGKTLSKPEAVAHFENLLGNSPLAVDFIAAFNARRQAPTPSVSVSENTIQSDDINAVPKSKRAPKKKKPQLHTPQARQVDSYAGPSGTVYSKKSDLDYITQSSVPSGSSPKPTVSNGGESSSSSSQAAAPPPKKHASSTGFLISESLSKPKNKSNPTSRSSTPKPSASTTKISISGGTPMAGQSTAIADLDAAIRALETSTNPSLDNVKSRRCNCVATRHPLQTAVPNCLSCGKVICMKEGLGPCTFCGAALLTSDEVQAMVRELKDERGRERMAVNANANRRAEISQKPIAFSQNKATDTGSSSSSSLADAAIKAREHRDKLLNFQAENAQRTTVRDEAADFDVTAAVTGRGSMWSTPEDRARELKRQQKLLREMEWNARPEYEKRKQVMSIDIVGGKVVRKMATADRPPTPEEEEEDEALEVPVSSRVLSESNGNSGGRVGGAFSGNPLLGSVMKPVFKAKAVDGSSEVEETRHRERKTRWRRVQDNLEDNEDLILDGGIRGHTVGDTGDEPACG